ncbi:hypothetical protein DFH94DRAFT_679854 [Russula ochroleuca]|uniref:Uncharacterized protein n=1 Tax=Russula ochroleuca TaxID=152965 RepID=A0A9P5N0C7_9AGAM|nr:hypothetical protein DFH94DRAFT_679854 [Russula ochroleuca]
MSYPHNDPYQQDNAHGGQPFGYDNRRNSRSHSLQPTVQGGDNPLVNRSLSNTRTPATGQAQPFGTYGTGQNREQGLPYVSSAQTPQYPQAQGHSASFQNQIYQSGDPYMIQALDAQSPHLVSPVSPHNRTPYLTTPQQPSVPQSASHSAQAQYQYQRGDPNYSVGNPQHQRTSSTSRYPQQQQSSHQAVFAVPPDDAAASFGPNVPGELHGEVTRQSRSMRRDTSSGRTLVLNVALWVFRDDLRRGVPPCPACNKCPRRLNGNYCGSSCERWDMERRQQPQRQQSYPPSGVRPHSQPTSGITAWSTSTNTSLSTSSLEANNQYLSPGGLGDQSVEYNNPERGGWIALRYRDSSPYLRQ